MDIRIPYIIQDPLVPEHKGIKATEGVIIRNQPFFLDGPVTKRVAILDFDETGALRPGVRFAPPKPGHKLGKYEIKNENDLYARDFMAVSVFATVFNTMSMYEEEDTLGRELSWAFMGTQLLVIPRAGESANAYYERDSHSLQFFHFPTIRSDGSKATVYTALSQDIVAHETGHAILDGIAPDLYNCITPQALAIHEGVADISALLMAFRSDELRRRLLEQTGGSIKGNNAFVWLAEEFGTARDGTKRANYLRSLWNEKTLDSDDDSRDEDNNRNRVSRTEPHELSQVLTGALYRVIYKLHEKYKHLEQQDGRSAFSVSGKALYMAYKHSQRLILRALDYLPPGEVSFGDYGRAILAADQASHPEDSLGRDILVDEFKRRHIVPDREALEVETGFEHPGVASLDLDALVNSDWVAYDFVNLHRELFSIPPEVNFCVLPRLKVTKKYYLTNGPVNVKECILKVSWDHQEPNEELARLPPQRQITVGTTLAIDWESHEIRALLPSHATITKPESDQQQHDRNRMLKRLLDAGQLRIGSEQDGHHLGTQGIHIETVGPLMRVRGTARLLHIISESS